MLLSMAGMGKDLPNQNNVRAQALHIQCRSDVQEVKNGSPVVIYN